MFHIATFIKNLTTPTADQRLYRVSPPVSFTFYDEDCEEVTQSTDYVVTSAIIHPYSGPETYIFPADENGEIINRSELPGSFRGELNHERVLTNAGYDIVVSSVNVDEASQNVIERHREAFEKLAD